MTFSVFTGIEYLKIDIASSFGLDKADWDDRISWFDKHEDELEQLTPAADEPVLFHAGVQAYREAIQGKPIGYPISLDAASSGLQLLACLAGCRDSALLCGVVSTGHREDAYTVLYGAMCQKLGSVTQIERKDVKQAIMTSLYSSIAVPKRVFGEGDQLKVFFETMAERAPGAWELNFGLQGLWQSYAKSHDWVLPDNFHVHVPVNDRVIKFVQVQGVPVAVDLKVNQGTKEGRSISPNVVHSVDGMIVREMHRRCDYHPETIDSLRRDLRRGHFLDSERRDQDKVVLRLLEHYRESGFLSARILDHLDAINLGHLTATDILAVKELLDSLPERPFPVISIHDCFRVHPNHGNDLRRTYNQILSEIAASDMLAFIASQVMGTQVSITKLGDISKDILHADYALC